MSEKKPRMPSRKTGKNLIWRSRQQSMGIWQWEPATGTMILSGEHPALLGINKTMFKNTFEDFKTYIHPERQRKYRKFSQGNRLGKST